MSAFPPKPGGKGAPGTDPAGRSGFRRPQAAGRPYHVTPECFLSGLANVLLAPAGSVLVALIAWLDACTGPRVSFSAFYLIPIAVASWWGGFAHGILMALAGTLAWQYVDAFFHPGDPPIIGLWNGIVRFGTFVILASMLSRLRLSVAHEQLLARTDPLTGASNARTFYDAVAREAERARRSRHPVTLAYLDLDNFKQVNDRLGHGVGDEVLFHFVQTLRQNLRLPDVVARLGGDEFALLLPGTGGEGATALLHGLQGFVGAEMVRKGWPVTVSIGGVTFHDPPRDVDVMVRHVDALMYQVKRAGRNGVNHQVYDGPAQFPVAAGAFERRVAARVLCDRPARVSLLREAAPGEEVATVKDISAGGIGLQAPCLFPPGSVLSVEGLFRCGTKPLLARVVRAIPRDGGWFHGCALSTQLVEEEMRAWATEQLADTVAPWRVQAAATNTPA